MDEPITAEFAEATQRDCVCAGCWGHLLIYNHQGAISVECPRCGPDRGFVTKGTAERRRAENGVEFIDAQQNLAKILNLPIARKTEKELLSELGF